MIVNGVTLPDIPAEVLEQYPYIFITHGESTLGTEAYTIIASATEFLHMSPDIFPDIEEGLYCLSDSKMIDYDSDEAAWNEDGSVLPAMTNLLVFQNAGIGTMTIVYSNYDIYTVASINADTEEFTKGEIYFPNSEAEEEPEETKPPRYSIATAILDAVARQIMRLTDSTTKVKPEEFEAKLESVSKGGELPSAEDAYFGMRDTGLQESITDYGGTYNSSGTTGYQFTPLKDFVVSGVKVLARSTVYPNKIRLFDVETQEKLLSLDAVGSEWVEIILNEQINLYAGKTYAISVYNGYGYYFSPSETSFNPNIKYVGGYYNSDEVATCPTNNSAKRICAAIVTLAPKPEENIIYEYKIQTTTLNDIADEVIRITGRSDSMSPASILSALQGIETVTTE